VPSKIARRRRSESAWLAWAIQAAILAATSACVTVSARQRSRRPRSRLRKRGDVILRQPPSAGMQNEAEELGGLDSWQDGGLARVQPEPPALQVAVDARAPDGQHTRVVMEQGEIGNVPDIGGAQHFGHPVVEAVEVEVGEELAGQVASRQPAAAPVGLEQVIAGEVQLGGLLRVGAVHHAAISQSVRSHAMRGRKAAFRMA